MLKMETKDGVTVVREEGEVKFSGTYADALRYVFYKRFIALVNGEPIYTRTDKRYPVDSLIPTIGRTKKTVFMVEGEVI